MAYVNSEKSKTVKQQLKAMFPETAGWKFSVTIEHHSTLNIRIISAPVQLIENGETYQQFNVYHLNNYRNAETLNAIHDIANAGNFDNSDIMTDYHHVGFYVSIAAGEWNKPFVYTGTPEAAEEAINNFIETELAKRNWKLVEEGTANSYSYEFSEKGVERKIFVTELEKLPTFEEVLATAPATEPATEEKPAKPELTTLAQQILPLFPNAVQGGGESLVLAQTSKTEDKTMSTLLLRWEGYLDIDAGGRWYSEKSPKFMKFYQKYFAPLATPAITEETPEPAPAIEAEAEGKPEKLTNYQLEALKRLAATSAAAPRPYADMQPRSVRRAADKLALLGLAVRVEQTNEPKPFYYILPAGLLLLGEPAPVAPETTVKTAVAKPTLKAAPEPEKPLNAAQTAEELAIGTAVEYAEAGIRYSCLVTQTRAKKVQIKICGEIGNLENKPAQTVRWATREELTRQITPKTARQANSNRNRNAPALRLVPTPPIA